MERYVLTLDLQDDARLIAEYERWHQEVWPEIKESIFGSGIRRMEIYRFSNRLVMVMETDDGFSFEQKAEADAANPRVQEWEQLMWTYQRPVRGANPGEKWVLMDKIFELSRLDIEHER
ncbi:L-rhamnose mutarotase [Parapedobacter composti]|uniref:L-rhamnose mutarotase n=1 Tax=Parapedobacter composti TaxID=623281 RepID=A0A1I1JQ51_9SPHI|nr:L-rhamnose mutarotase [Parapedobacter composti]SFC47500.1 L-rhamnose mutarotase [Parapedobacter composti]